MFNRRKNRFSNRKEKDICIRNEEKKHQEGKKESRKCHFNKSSPPEAKNGMNHGKGRGETEGRGEGEEL